MRGTLSEDEARAFLFRLLRSTQGANYRSNNSGERREFELQVTGGETFRLHRHGTGSADPLVGHGGGDAEPVRVRPAAGPPPGCFQDGQILRNRARMAADALLRDACGDGPGAVCVADGIGFD